MNTEEKARRMIEAAKDATPGEVVEKTESSGFKSYHLETCPGDIYNDTLANFYGNKTEADFAAAANPEAITEILRDYLRMKGEESDESKWESFCRESDVRCIDCSLRYGERDQYGCVVEMKAHRYVECELAAARNLEKP